MFGLVPREEKYFAMLNQLAAKVREGGEVFAKIFKDFSNHAQYADEIKQIEVESDDIAAKITQKLNSSFITPIDREDIYLLVTELDDVIDMINDLARRLEIYNITALKARFGRDREPVEQVDGRDTGRVRAVGAQPERGRALSQHQPARKARRFTLPRRASPLLQGREGPD